MKTHSKKKSVSKLLITFWLRSVIHLDAPPYRLGRKRKTLVREKDSLKSQIAPEEEPKRKSSVTGCQGGKNRSSPSHIVPEQTSVVLFSTQHSRRCSTPLLALSQWEGGLPLVASNLPHPVTAQLGTKDQPNFHVPLMIAEKSNR